MKVLIVSVLALLASSAMAAPQFEAISGLINSASQAVGSGINSLQAIGSLLPSSNATEEKPNPLGCTVYFTGKPEGEVTAQASGGSYSICFEPEESTCGIQFDFTLLISPPKPANEQPLLVSQPQAAVATEELCENYIIFPPTSSSFGSKAVCLDKVVEPSVLLIGTPMVVYAHTRPGKQFTIPYSYLTNC